jgi:hypothetical protein
MKQNLILWIAAGIILFISAYFKTVTSDYYPLSGSFGIEGKKITFKFDRISREEKDYKLIVRNDHKKLTGFLDWRKEGDEWTRVNLKNNTDVLTAFIPKHPAGTKIYYKVSLKHKDNTIVLPSGNPAVIEFRNKISSAANGLYYFFLFGGLLLSIRTGLEIFRSNDKVKALTVFTIIFFTLFAFIFSPLRNSYDAGFLEGQVPGPSELFVFRDISYFIIWIIGSAALFILKLKYSPLLASLVVLILFLILGYPR